MFGNRPYTFDRVVRLTLSAGLLWALIKVLGYLSDVLIPFAVALLLAYLINPFVLFIQRKIRNHSAAVFVSLTTVVLVILLLIVIILPMIIGEVRHMGVVVTDLVNNSEIGKRADQILPKTVWDEVEKILAGPDVQSFFKTDKFLEMIEAAARKILPGVWGLISGTTSLLTGLLGIGLIILYLVFLLMDYKKVKDGWKDLIPVSQKDMIVNFVRDVDEGMNRYFRGQAIVAGIVGVLFAFGFTLIGLPLSILFGLFVGLLNMVPYLQTLAYPPALVLGLVHALDTGSGIWMYLGLVSLVFVVVQAIQDTILVPKIMGSVTGLSPAVILLSLSIWGKMLGMFGLIIALPMTAILLAYYRRFLSTAAYQPAVENQNPLPLTE